MLGPIFFDDVNNCGGDFFDNIEDFLDFPDPAVEGGLVGGGEFDNFQGVWSQPPPPQQQQQPPQMDALAASTTVFSDTKNTNTSSELPVPYEDFPPLEWLSSFMEDSFSPGSIIPDKDTIANITDVKSNNSSISSNNNTTTNNFQHQFQTSSPVSVLESSSSCSDGKTMPLNAETFIRGRARSKRPRPAAFNPRSVIQLISPTSSITEGTTTSSELLSEVGNHAESRLMMKISEPNTSSESKQRKKIKIKKRNLPPLPGSMDHQTSTPSAAPVRKCMHCEISKTPQWRAGPMGPKTLCNACGVRFKSGRLYPEYRPAASPTFVAALHSNSHKKVLEMRIRSCEKLQKPEFMPSSGHLVEQV